MSMLKLNEGPRTPDGGSSSAHGPTSGEPREENLDVVPLSGDGYGRLHRVPVHHHDNCTSALARVKVDAGTTKAVQVVLNKILYFGEEALF